MPPIHVKSKEMLCSHTATDVFFTMNQNPLNQSLFCCENQPVGIEERGRRRRMRRRMRRRWKRRRNTKTERRRERMRRRRTDYGKRELRDEQVEGSSAKSDRKRR